MSGLFFLAWKRLSSAREIGACTPASGSVEVGEAGAREKQATAATRSARSKGSIRLKRRKRRDYLTEAFGGSDDLGLVPKGQPAKHDISHVNVRSRQGRQAFHANRERHAGDKHLDLAHTKELRLERITATLIQHANVVTSTLQPPSTIPYKLMSCETSYLQAKGITIVDVQAWAAIISTQDSHDAAERLANYHTRLGGQPAPLFVLQYLLRRPHLNARALRILVQQSWQALDLRLDIINKSNMSENAVFILFVRLLRHAREVWPTAVPSITDMLLHHLPRVFSSDYAQNPKQVESLTYLLNKAMHLLAMETAVEPFKDVVYQEAAIIQVLRFMTQHKPALQLNREGYRAVVRIQLAQKKTPSDRQWAELKILSWPPWKQERTAMDALITPEKHGLTRAGDTLRRMKEAGYAPRTWEKAAGLYAGWDVDLTPTIQTRKFLGSISDAAIWAARISTTRTAQEAWAAYLAFEDAKLAPSQDVYLAIVRKLFAEERRQRAYDTDVVDSSTHHGHHNEPVLPGDAAEVEPLPPSTHLYTYVRAGIPTVEGFVHQLRDRNVDLDDHCVSFLVSNAGTLQLGLSYMRSNPSSQAALEALFTLQPSTISTSVPTNVFSAFIELLCRFANVPLYEVSDKHYASLARSPLATPLLNNQQLNLQHPLVYALELVKLSRTTSRPAWNSLLRALTREATLKSVAFLLRDHERATSADLSDIQMGRNAMLAYSLVRRVLSMLHETHLDLDSAGFYHLCLATENVTFACWKILRRDLNHAGPGLLEESDQRAVVGDANKLLRSSSHVTRLKGLFRVLVGDNDGAASRVKTTDSDVATASNLPPLLAVPGPALLHAYIRALGWLGDHHGLLAVLNWMVEHRAELAEKRARDRNGEVVMRRAVVTLRVFLERSWLEARHIQDGDGEQHEQGGDRRVRNCRRLETAASVDVVGEARRLVEGVEDWGGWPEDEEVDGYCVDRKFEEVRSLYVLD